MAITLLTLLAIQFSGTVYKWGGENAIDGLDCSGYIQKVLKLVKLDPPGDQTAQMLYNHFIKQNLTSELGPDSLLFFGRSTKRITHVALAINNQVMIEAGGGDSRTRTYEDAVKREARVRIVPISNRKDLVAAIKLKYNVESVDILSAINQ